MNAKDRADWPEIHELASFLAAEVIAEGGPADRREQPAALKAALGCFFPMIAIGVHGLAYGDEGIGVVVLLVLVNWVGCSVAAYIGRYREFMAINRRLRRSVLMTRIDVDQRMSFLLRNPEIDWDADRLRVARRAEALQAGEETLSGAAIVVGQAMAGKAPMGHSVVLEWPSGAPPGHFGVWIFLLLAVGAVIAGTFGFLTWPTAAVGAFAGISVFAALRLGRESEFRDRLDRIRSIMAEATDGGTALT